MSPAVNPASALPLQRYRLFQSSDVDQAREFVAKVFCPHELSTTERGSRLDACHHSAPLFRETSLNYVQYGPQVRIEPGYLQNFYLLQMPLRGGALVRCGAKRVQAHAALASFPSPSERLSMVWGDDSPHLIVKMERLAMQRRLEALLQSPLSDPLVFQLGLELGILESCGLAALIAHLRTALDVGDSYLQHPLLAEQAENQLLCTMLLCAPHNYSTRLRHRALSAGGLGIGSVPHHGVPRAVRRAQEYMQAHIAAPITLADVCTHVAVSARSLQQAFLQHTGSAPMAFLRDRRLDAVRGELDRVASSTAPDGASVRVQDVAARFGFYHLGHFAAHYRRRFGETPSVTRRRR